MRDPTQQLRRQEVAFLGEELGLVLSLLLCSFSVVLKRPLTPLFQLNTVPKMAWWETPPAKLTFAVMDAVAVISLVGFARIAFQMRNYKDLELSGELAIYLGAAVAVGQQLVPEAGKHVYAYIVTACTVQLTESYNEMFPLTIGSGVCATFVASAAFDVLHYRLSSGRALCADVYLFISGVGKKIEDYLFSDGPWVWLSLSVIPILLCLALVDIMWPVAVLGVQTLLIAAFLLEAEADTKRRKWCERRLVQALQFGGFANCVVVVHQKIPNETMCWWLSCSLRLWLVLAAAFTAWHEFMQPAGVEIERGKARDNGGDIVLPNGEEDRPLLLPREQQSPLQIQLSPSGLLHSGDEDIEGGSTPHGNDRDKELLRVSEKRNQAGGTVLQNEEEHSHLDERTPLLPAKTRRAQPPAKVQSLSGAAFPSKLGRSIQVPKPDKSNQQVRSQVGDISSPSQHPDGQSHGSSSSGEGTKIEGSKENKPNCSLKKAPQDASEKADTDSPGSDESPKPPGLGLNLPSLRESKTPGSTENVALEIAAGTGQPSNSSVLLHQQTQEEAAMSSAKKRPSESPDSETKRTRIL